jgi:hypothetical protein
MSSIVIANTHSYGRFANQFIRAMGAHFISKNLNISAEYPFDMNVLLGLNLHNNDKTVIDKSKSNTIYLTDNNFMNYINNPTISIQDNTILNLNNIYCQTREHSLKIYEFVNEEKNKLCIINKNKYNTTYNKNNNVFIHVRLGDVIDNNPGANYYKKVLSKIKFDAGYISSDSINHPICTQLINEFKLIPIYLNEIDTIHFGSMCKHIVLSNGTFSWLIGLLGFSSDVYWPEIKKVWHGDIFECMPNWKKVSY